MQESTGKLYKQGKIHAITGFGKYKSSGAFGTALRAINQNWQVLIIQFIKNSETGEINVFEKHFKENVKVMRYGYNKITLPTNANDEDKAETQRGWSEMLEEINSKDYDLLILDEVLPALDMKLLFYNQYFGFLKSKPEKLEVISTGRINNKELMQKIELNSNLVSDIYCKKHYFNTKCPNCKRSFEYHNQYCSYCGTQLEKSVHARLGIEF